MSILPFERKLVEFVTKYRGIIFFAIITTLSVLIRTAGKDIIGGDMYSCLLPWFDEIRHYGGFWSLDRQVGNYNLLYQTFIAIFTYIDVNPVYQYKILSAVFDYGIAVVVSMYITELKGKEFFSGIFNTCYATILFIPTVVLNSSYWGQCDAIYTFWAILSIISILNNKFFRGFAFFGIALAFKLQAIFFLPIIICIYIIKRSFSMFNLVISIMVFWFSGIVTFFFGRDIFAGFRIYTSQADEYHWMYMNVPSFWVMVGDNYRDLSKMALYTFMILCVMMAYQIIRKRVPASSDYAIWRIGAWFLWTCILFLPAMHERYSFALDIVLILLAFMNMHNFGFALIESLASTITYGYFMYVNGEVNIPLAFIYFMAWIVYTLDLMNVRINLNKIFKE